MADNVNHPIHYNTGGYECIDVLKAIMTHEAYRGFLKGNVLKYLWREKNKGNLESLRKAQWYLTELIKLDGEAD